jgi:hypothetical protein
MITKKDLESHVVNTQMIKRGICSADEAKERQKAIDHIEAQEGFFSYGNDLTRVRISKGIIKRRNSAYKLLVDGALGEKNIRLERYIYFCLQKEQLPDPKIIEIKLNI